MNIQTTIRLSCVLLIAFAATALQAKTTENRGLSFTENKGQITDQHYQPRTDIDFKMETPQGMNIFIGDGQLHYQWNKADDNTDKSAKEYKIVSYRLDVELQGANRNAEVISEGRSEDYDQYYKEYLPLEGAKAYSYSKVTYKNIYPKIDWVLYSINNELKYDFVVHAGGDPSAIKLKYAGATSLASNNGAVTITTPFGSITEGKPYSYDAETKEIIASSFLLNGNTLGFNVAAANRAIIIDPSVNWITYYGGGGSGSLEEFGPGITTDVAGNAYMAGKTTNTSNIASTGAFQTTYMGMTDGMVVKFNKAGVRQWATYYGGSNIDVLSDVAVDNNNGNIYCAGYTESLSGIATPGAYITNGWQNYTMLIKFDSNGARIWGTYYYHGYINMFNMNPAQVCCDALGNVYMCYFSEGLKVVKFLPSGAPQWNNAWTPVGTYYESSDIVADLSGNIYVVGDDMGSVYLGKMDVNGVNVYTKVIGGASFELGYGIAVDAAGDVYVSGHTMSATGIATAGTQRNVVNPNLGGMYYDGFLVKYNSAGVKQWGTYVGTPTGGGHYCSVAAGLNGKLYVAYKAASGGGGFVNVSTFNSQNGLELSSFALPSGNEDNYTTIAWSPIGNVYISGVTRSTSGFTTPGAYQTVLNGYDDLFLASYTVDTLVSIDQPFNDTVLCAGSTFKLPYNVNDTFAGGNTFTAYLSDANGSFTSPVSIGSFTSSVSDTIVCTIPLSTLYGTGYRVRIAANLPVAISEDNGIDIRIDSAVTPVILTYTANPGTNVLTGTSVTFSTTLSGMGSTPTYQWKKNNVDISGANSATYTGVAGTDFMTNDTITVEVGSSVACANPSSITSSQLVMTVTLGVKDLYVEGWNIYPNPTNGKLVLNGTASGTVNMQVLNMAGQQVYEMTEQANGNVRAIIELDSKLANGMYMLRIATGEDVQTTRFSLQR